MSRRVCPGICPAPCSSFENASRKNLPGSKALLLLAASGAGHAVGRRGPKTPGSATCMPATIRLGLLSTTAIVGFAAAVLFAAHADALVVGAESTWSGATSDFNSDLNWTPAQAPVAAGSSALFSNAGSATVNVGGAIAPDAWTFNAGALSYMIAGAAVNFGGAGITNNAASAISIANAIGGTGGIAQAGTGILTLSGANTYTGGTTVSGGSLNVEGTLSSLVTLSNGAILRVASGGAIGTAGLSVNGTGAFDIVNLGSITSTTSGSSVNTNATVRLITGAGSTISANQHEAFSAVGAYSSIVNAAGATIQGGSDTQYGRVYLGNNATVTNYGTMSGSAILWGIGYTSGALMVGTNSTVDLRAGSTTGTVRLGNGSTLSLYTGSGTAAPGYIMPDLVTGANITAQNPGTNAAATVGEIAFGTGGTLTLRGTGDGTAANGVTGALNMTNVFGATTLSKLDSGTFVLTGDNSDQLATNVTAGRLVASNTAGAFGTGTVTISAGATVELSNTTPNDVFELAGLAFTGAGTLEKTGAGIFAIGGSAPGSVGLAQGGLINVVAGTLRGSTQNHGDWSTNNGGLTIASGATFDGVEGAIRVDGLNGAGTLQGSAPTTIGVAGGDGVFAGTIQNSIYGGGALALTKAGSGTQTLSGANTYTGGTTISAGTLQIGNGGTSGSITGDVTNNAALAFNRSDNVTFGGVISGSGAVNHVGTGTTTLIGANTYTGGTTFAAGTLNAGSADALGTAGTLSFTGGTLQYSASNQTDYSSRFSMADGQAFKIDTNNQTVTYATSMTSSSSLTKLGGGTLILTGNNSYSGGTTVSAGTLQIGNGFASPGYVTGNVALSGGELTFARNLTFDGVISGSGAVNQIGTGYLSLTGDNTYTGGTRILGGTLWVGDGGTTGTLGSGNVDNQGTLVFQRTDAQTFANVIGNTGSVEQTGSGTTTLTGANTYTGGTTFRGGILNLGSAGALGTSGTLSFTGGTLQYGVSNQTDYSGRFSNAASQAYLIDTNGQNVTYASSLTSSGGSLSKLGLGTLTLSGTNTYSGGTTLSAGIVNAGSAGALGATGAINFAGGTLQYSTSNQTDYSSRFATAAGQRYNIDTNGQNVTYATALSSSGGRLTKLGTGTLTLNGANGFTGGTTVSAGTLSLQSLLTNAGIVTVASGATLDAVAGITNLAGASIVNSGTLRDDLNNAGTVTNSGAAIANVATNTSGIQNSGTWTGNVASSTGSIVNNGVWTGNINSSGNYSGTGSVSGLSLTGGNFTAGNGSAGSSTTVTGNLALTSGVHYAVRVNPATASFTSVTGTAALGGAAVNARFDAGSYVAKQYTIVSTQGGVTGSFGTLTSANLPTNVTASLSTDARNAYLNLELKYTAPAPVGAAQSPLAPQFSGLNRNQTNVAGALVNSFNTNGGIAMAFASLSAAGLSQVSGELGAGTQQATFDAMGQFMGMMTDPSTAGRSGAAPQGAIGYADEAPGAPNDAMAAMSRKATASPLFEQRWNVWAAGFGGSQTTDGNALAGSSSASSRIYGGAAGADYRISPNTTAGFALAGGGTSFAVANSGSGRSDLFQAGGFVRHTVGAAYLTAAMAYGWQDVTTDRSVGADRFNGRFSSNALSGRLEAGHRWIEPVLGMGLTPYAAAQVTSVSLPGYAEKAVATNTFGLNYAAKDATATRSELGLRTDKSFALSDGVLTLRSRAAWAHNFDGNRSVTATFQALPGASFVVNSAAQGREAALVTGSAEIAWLNGWSLSGTFEGEFSNVTRSYAGKGVMRYGW